MPDTPTPRPTHTAGPWIVDHSTDGRSGLCVRGGDIRPDCMRPPTIAKLPHGSTVRGYEEATANARLIAAAPDMLESLRVALDYIETTLAETSQEAHNKGRAEDVVRSAIAKAEGRA